MDILRQDTKVHALVIITSVGLIAFFIAQMISQFTGGATSYCFNNRIGPRNFAFDFWNR
ncbi:MAG: hypothetical protein ACLUR5_10150 [Eubacterium ventriosum]